jgi:CRP-like cAMP-binding protein
MIISTINAPNPAVVMMQACYILISLFGIARVFVMARMLRQTPEEREFISKHLPDLRREHVRPLLKRAKWKNVPAGVTLCKQDERLDSFCFLAEGEAAVSIDGRFIGNSHDCFVGGLSFMTDGPATATVVTSTPSRILVFERALLTPLIRRQPEIKLALIAGFSNAAKSMLLRRNQEALRAGGAVEAVDAVEAGAA